MPDFGEQCDDGNILDGDCCSSTCGFEAAGEPCPGDASFCTVDECDGAGSCMSTPPSCKESGKSILLITKKTDEAKDKLVFKWLKGLATDVSELGDPLSTADYALCLYTGPLLNPFFEATIPASSTKWNALSTKGFRYKDSTGVPTGVTNVLLRSGNAGKSKALVKAKGANLPLPAFGFLPLPVTAQLVNSETNACFEATYVAPDVKKNDAGQFKAKAP
jgi:cysteine-rich repeat protein